MSAAKTEKQDPESFALRAGPRPIRRFKRPVVIAIAAAGAAGITGLVWLGFHPIGPLLPAKTKDAQPAAPARPPADIFGTKAPSYASVPVLGPPLPGDLGRPIVENEKTRMATIPEGGEPSSAPRASSGGNSVFFRVADADAASATSEQTSSSATPAVATTPAASDAKQSPATTEAAASDHVLLAGTIVAASLITAVNSDAPGVVVAQITSDVFDSVSGRNILIPCGSRLIGRYDTKIAYGQTRVQIAWHRLILPNGVSVALDNIPASDAAGAGGLKDQVDGHTGALLKGVGVSALLALAAQPANGGSEAGTAWALRNAIQQTLNQVGQLYVAKQMDIQPTLRIRAGENVYFVLETDLRLQPYPR